MDAAPTDRELEILKVLWELGEGSVRDVHARLTEESGLHFNTIQTQLRIMDDKQLVSHRHEGRTFIYKPLCTREQVSSRFLRKVFDGALDQLMLSMLKAEKSSTSELAELGKLIADARKQKQSQINKRGK
jgi:BlaI family penicillinase repressor